jgi:NitT/TauT family transport system permease protein
MTSGTMVDTARPESIELEGGEIVAPDRHFLGLSSFAWFKLLAPTVTFLLFILGWQVLVRVRGIPFYVLPAPSDIGQALVKDWPLLWSSLLVTLQITLTALSAAILLGLLGAIFFAQSQLIELSLFPLAVLLQVTPMVALAPLIIIWMDNVTAALLICAWIVAFFPILSNTTLGLNSADHNLLDLFRLYRASRWQVLKRLRIPTALPYFLGGLRISGGLSLIGSVVGEFVAGAGGRPTGLAYRILEAGYQLEIPRMFAALALVSATGITIFLLITLLSHLLLRNWHESATRGGGR